MGFANNKIGNVLSTYRWKGANGISKLCDFCILIISLMARSFRFGLACFRERRRGLGELCR